MTTLLPCSSRKENNVLKTFIRLKVWGHSMFGSITKCNIPESFSIDFWRRDGEQYKKYFT